MDAIIGRINQLTHEGTMPANKIKIAIDTSALDDAQKKADKLKATLLEVQELICQTNLTGADIEDRIIGNITDAVKAATTYRTTIAEEADR